MVQTLRDELMAQAKTQPRTLRDELMAEAKAPTAGERVAGVAGGLVRGAVNVAKGVFLDTPEILAEQIVKGLVPDEMEARMHPRSEGVLGSLSARLESGLPALSPESVRNEPAGPGRFLTTTVPEAIGSTAGFALSGGAGGLGGAALTGALSGGSAAFIEAKASGASDETAWVAWALNAGISSSEALPLGRILERYTGGQAGGTIKAALLSATEEGAQEAFQQVGSNLAASATFDEDRKALEGLAESAGAGGLTGFILSAIGSAVGARNRGNLKNDGAETFPLQDGAQEKLGITEPAAPAGFPEETVPVPPARLAEPHPQGGDLTGATPAPSEPATLLDAVLQRAAEPEPLADPKVRAELEGLASEAGWEEMGGKLLRNELGEVVGRTKWSPKAEWWTDRPSGMTEKSAKSLVEKVLANPQARLGEKQQRHLDWLIHHAQSRASQPVGGFSASELREDFVQKFLERSRSPVGRFLEANESEGEVVEPSTPEEVYASEFLKQRGAKLTLVKGEKPFKLPGMYQRGEVILDANRPGALKALAFHEITHRLAAELPGSYQALFQELAQADRQGLGQLGQEYQRRIEQTGRKLSPTELAEEATAFYAESIPTYLEHAFEKPQRLAALAQSNPGLLRRIADAIVQVLQKIKADFGLKTSQQKALLALRRELARTPFEKALAPDVAARVAQRIASAVNELRGPQAATEQASEEREAAAVSDEAPFAVAESGEPVDTRTSEERRKARSDARAAVRELEQLAFAFDAPLPAADRRAGDGRERSTGKAGSGATTLLDTIKRDMLREGRVDLRGQIVKSPQDLAVLAQVYTDPRFETFRLFYVDGAGKILAHEGTTSRMPGVAIVPLRGKQLARDVRTLRERMRRLGATGYYLLHNHPSGKPLPSEQDVQVTGRFIDAVPGFRGHIVIDHDSYGVIDHRLQTDVRRLPATRPATFELRETHLLTPQALARFASEFPAPDKQVALIHTAMDGRVRAVQSVPDGLFRRTQEFADFVRGQARAFGSGQVFVATQTASLKAAAARAIATGTLVDAIVGVESIRGGAAHSDALGTKVKRPDLRMERVGEPEARFAVAFHGSPYDFDRFDSSKIGTGEGAQAYGHGLYFTDKREIAEHYKEKLAPTEPHVIRHDESVPMDLLYVAQERLAQLPRAERESQYVQRHLTELMRRIAEEIDSEIVDPDGAHAERVYDRDQLMRAADALESRQLRVREVSKGKLYTVELAPQEDEYLLWDRPLSEQSEKVKAALRAVLDIHRDRGGSYRPDGAASVLFGTRHLLTAPLEETDERLRDLAMQELGEKYPSGQMLYRELVAQWSRRGIGVDNPGEAASSALHAIGIRGIKYLAGDSRGKGEGSYNYVLFDDKDVTIKEKFAVEADEDGQEGFDLPAEGRLRRVYTALVDDLERIKQAEKVSPQKLEGESVSQTLQLHPGRKFGGIEKLSERFVEPIKKALKTWKISPDDAAEFLYALHAPTRNAIIAERSPEKFGTESNPGSGMTNSEAKAIVEKALASEAGPGYRRLKRLNRQLNKLRLDTLEQGGLLSSESRAEWEKFGADYVPLRTKGEPGELVFGTRSFNVSGKESKRAEGRKSRADSPLVFGLATAEQAIERAERNKVGQQIAKLVEANPEGPWRIESDANQIDRDAGEVGLRFKENGEQRFIVVKDKALADSFKRIVDPEPGVLKFLDPVNQWLRSVIITYSPVFPLTNVPRDIGTAAIKSAITGDWSATVGALKGALPAAYGAWRAIRNPKSKGKWQDVYRRARDAGALIGWSQPQDFEQRAREFQKVVDGSGSLKAKGEAFLKFWKDANSATELGTRLAVFDALIKAGQTEQEAAVKARRVTADFARRGRWAPVYSRLWLFSGANVQGTAEMAEAIAKNPRRASLILGGLIGMGFVMAMLSHIYGDEDELEKLSEEDKARFMGIQIGEARYGVAAAYGFNVFPYIGWKLYETTIMGEDPMDAIGGVTRAALDSMSPLPRGANLTQQMTPSVARPFVEIGQNRNFADAPIAPEVNPFDPSPPPNVDRAFRGVSPVSKSIAEGLYEGSGEAIDISPEWIDHLAKAATGGAGTFAGRMTENVRKTIAGELDHERIEDIPLIGPLTRPFAQQPSRGAEGRLYYELRSEIDEARDRSLKERSLSERQKRLLAVRPQLLAAERELKRLREQRKAADDKTAQEIDTLILEAQRRFLAVVKAATKKP